MKDQPSAAPERSASHSIAYPAELTPSRHSEALHDSTRTLDSTKNSSVGSPESRNGLNNDGSRSISDSQNDRPEFNGINQSLDRRFMSNDEKSIRRAFRGEFDHKQMDIPEAEHGLRNQSGMPDGGARFNYDPEERADGLRSATRSRHGDKDIVSKAFEGREDGLISEKLSFSRSSRELVRGFADSSEERLVVNSDKSREFVRTNADGSRLETRTTSGGVSTTETFDEKGNKKSLSLAGGKGSQTEEVPSAPVVEGPRAKRAIAGAPLATDAPKSVEEKTKSAGPEQVLADGSVGQPADSRQRKDGKEISPTPNAPVDGKETTPAAEDPKVVKRNDALDSFRKGLEESNFELSPIRNGKGPFQSLQKMQKNGQIHMSHEQMVTEARRISERHFEESGTDYFKRGDKPMMYSSKEIDQRVEAERQRLTRGEVTPGEETAKVKAPEKIPGEETVKKTEKTPAEEAAKAKTPGEKSAGEETAKSKIPGEKTAGEETAKVKTPAEKATEEATKAKTPGGKAAGEETAKVKTPNEKMAGEETSHVKVPNEKTAEELAKPKPPGESMAGEETTKAKTPAEMVEKPKLPEERLPEVTSTSPKILDPVSDSAILKQVPDALYIGQEGTVTSTKNPKGETKPFWLSGDAARALADANKMLEPLGKKVQLESKNSAGRTIDTQTEIYNRSNHGSSFAAGAPTKSNHVRGRAMDIANHEDRDVRRALLAVGFKQGDSRGTIAGDEHHWSFPGSYKGTTEKNVRKNERDGQPERVARRDRESHREPDARTGGESERRTRSAKRGPDTDRSAEADKTVKMTNKEYNRNPTDYSAYENEGHHAREARREREHRHQREREPRHRGRNRGDATSHQEYRNQENVRADMPALADPQGGRPEHISLKGEPTISAAQIDKVLQENNSPAANEKIIDKATGKELTFGQHLYKLGVEFGMDPAIALGFFKAESTFGKFGKAAHTNSFGNIKGGPGFRGYDSFADGARDWFKLVSGDLYFGSGRTTLGPVLERYAPPYENDTAGYVRNVAHDARRWSARSRPNG